MRFGIFKLVIIQQEEENRSSLLCLWHPPHSVINRILLMPEGSEFSSPSEFISMAPEFSIPITLQIQFCCVLQEGFWVREIQAEQQRKAALEQLSSSLGNSFLTNQVPAHAFTVHVEIHLPDKLLPQTSSFIISLDNYTCIFFCFISGVICDGSEHLALCSTQLSLQLMWGNKCHFRDVLFFVKVVS